MYVNSTTHKNLSGQSPASASVSRQEVVERAEAYMRAHIGCSIPVSRLSRIVGLSERGLRNAFYDVRGMSPKRSMLVERLHSVRRALIDSSHRPVTIASIATDYGFYELGRFAVTYKQTFGEAPSETRQRHRSDACRQPT